MPSKTSIFFVIILIFTVVAFIGCSDDDNPANSTVPFPAELVGEYVQTSVAVNGTSQDVSDFYDWGTGAVRTLLTVYTGGPETFQEFDTNDSVLYHDSGLITVVGQNMTVVLISEMDTLLASPDTVFSGTWDMTGSLMTLTQIEGADTVVMVNTKQ
ncbi:MAG: hypothetical protein KAR42_10005 [candidate division Zixibacteria bacterium]|nr:hypothetical protein [candidate division Zixibacteria bacterium]